VPGVLEKFSKWVGSGSFTARDLGIYRIIYSALALCMIPNFEWVSQYPDSLFAPPPGPFRLLHGFPSATAMVTLELLLVVALTLLLVGLFTRTVSIVSAVLAILGYGFSYSLGKIDHTILFLLVPVVMVAVDWGSAVSLDSRRRSRGASSRVRQWPLRYLGLLIGLAFMTAAVPKLLTGWLSPASQATQAHFYRQFYVNGRTDWFASAFLRIDFPLGWEVLDWATVALEAGILFAVVTWRSLRVVLAVACLFHLGVLLMMNISFYFDVIAYAAFVPWGRVRSLAALVERRWQRWVPWAAMPLIAVGAFGVRASGLEAENYVGPAVVIVAAVVAVWYLSRTALDIVTSRRRAVSPPSIVGEVAGSELLQTTAVGPDPRSSEG